MPDSGALDRKLGSKYFHPVGFPELETLEPPPEEAKKEEPNLDAEVLEKALEEMRKQIALMQVGKSHLKKIAIQFPKGNTPVLEAMKRIEAHGATRKDIKELLDLAEQDLGTRVARYFAEQFVDYDPSLKEKY